MNSLVSVLMCVYNSQQYLSEAIESILKQSYNNFEFIIVNDASTDDSKLIIKSYQDKRIKYFENKSNFGLTFSLNFGLKQCKGEFIARMDADDISKRR